MCRYHFRCMKITQSEADDIGKHPPPTKLRTSLILSPRLGVYICPKCHQDTGKSSTSESSIACISSVPYSRSIAGLEIIPIILLYFTLANANLCQHSIAHCIVVSLETRVDVLLPIRSLGRQLAIAYVLACLHWPSVWWSFLLSLAPPTYLDGVAGQLSN